MMNPNILAMLEELKKLKQKRSEVQPQLEIEIPYYEEEPPIEEESSISWEEEHIIQL